MSAAPSPDLLALSSEERVEMFKAALLMMEARELPRALRVLEALVALGEPGPALVLTYALCLAESGEMEKAAEAESIARRTLAVLDLAPAERARLETWADTVSQFLPGGVHDRHAPPALGWAETSGEEP